MERARTILLFGLFGARAFAPNEPAPMLRVQNSYGKAVDFAQITKTGNYILLWFYPKASSPGCTVQGKRYAQLYGDSQKLNVVVFGVSHDPAREQCKFIEKMALEGGMLPDQDGSIARAFKVGGVFGFYNRDTILINPEGNIEMVWRGVNPFKDADIVYKYLKDKTGK